MIAFIQNWLRCINGSCNLVLFSLPIRTDASVDDRCFLIFIITKTHAAVGEKENQRERLVIEIENSKTNIFRVFALSDCGLCSLVVLHAVLLYYSRGCVKP